MPLLFETGAYMLTWPRMLVYTDATTQVLDKIMPGSAQSSKQVQDASRGKLILMHAHR